MKVNGFRIQQRIRELQEERNLLTQRFTPALHRFEGEDGEDPLILSEGLSDLETKIAETQLAQARFNLQIEVDVDGTKMPLTNAIKGLGGLDRLTNLWRSAAGQRDAHARRYGHTPMTRDADTIVAERTVSLEKADELRKHFRNKATAIRAAIAAGNSQEVDAASIGYSE